MPDNADASLPDAPFLQQDPPPLAARSLATLLIVLASTMAVAAFVVDVPETVTARFVLAPITGSDPVRTLHQGTVAEVRVVEAQLVTANQPMFVVTSEPIGDRQAERAQLEMQLGGTDERLANERRRYEFQRRADEEELARLEGRLATLARQVDLREQQLALAREVVARQQKGFDEGITSWLQASAPKLDADRLAVDVEQTHADIRDTEGSIKKLRHQLDVSRVQLAELERSVRQEAGVAQARKTVLDAYTPRTENRFTVNAPCSGSVIKLNVRAPGAVVNPGDALAEIVCGDARLQAELEIPQLGMARIQPGQPVRLFYDAFPYQRYGVRQATLRWVSPASTVSAPGASFRALADLRDSMVQVAGQAQPVMAGMAGRASVLVGRRSIVSYAFEPIRQLRENLAAGER